VLGFESGLEAGEQFGLVFRAGMHGNGAVRNRNDRLAWRMPCQLTTRAPNAAGRSVLDEFGSAVRGVPAGRGELRYVLLTPDDRCREVIE